MTKELVGRFYATTAHRIAPAAALAIVRTPPMLVEIVPAIGHRFCGVVGLCLHTSQAPQDHTHFAQGQPSHGRFEPTRRPALRRPSGLWPPCGGTEHSGSNRAPDAPGETGPERVSISTWPHHRRRTSAPVLLESGRPL